MEDHVAPIEGEAVKFWRNDAIETRAEERLQQLKQHLGGTLTLPIEIDILAESILNLSILWDEIDELPGEVILGSIQPQTRRITMNDKRCGLFANKPGLERFTKGHEMGHWDLYVDNARLDHPAMFTNGTGAFSFRQSPAGQVVVVRTLMATEEGRDLLIQLRERSDDSDESRAVNRYAGAILMPRQLLKEEALRIKRTSWPDLYGLADKFGVTITALRVRLEQLNLLSLRDGQLYESREAAMGQRRLEF